jgi:hypothetical protein
MAIGLTTYPNERCAACGETGCNRRVGDRYYCDGPCESAGPKFQESVMAKKAKANGHTGDASDDDRPGWQGDRDFTETQAAGDGAAASNCTDETRREFYRKALLAKIALESAQAAAKTKNGEYRNVLKDAKKAGVDSNAITKTLAARFQDEEVLVLQLREELKMLDLGGVVPNVVDKILARIDIQEPTANEQHQTTLDRAYDEGALAGRSGDPRDSNQFNPGTDLHDSWDRGYLAGQRAIADEMVPMPPNAIPPSGGMPAEPPAPIH